MSKQWMTAPLVALALACGTSGGRPPAPVQGEILVKLKAGYAAPTQAPVEAAGTAACSQVAVAEEGGPLLRWPLPEGASPEEVAARAALDPAVEYAEPIQRYQSARRPNDPRYREQWALQAISAEQAWDVTTGSRNTVVAVVDSGINLAHPDLRANLWRNPGEIGNNGVDDDGNGFVDDLYGWDFVDDTADPSPKGEDSPETWHGSHVAGTIGADGDNRKGITGVAWRVQLMAVRALGPGGGRADQIATAIDYAVQNGARVINASWGGASSETIKRAIARASRAGVLFVAAAGNDGASGAGFPASLKLPNVIAVGASGPDEALADFSNHGRGVHVAAPGVSILSTTATGRYETLDGTSMAAPHVSGLAALLLSAAPKLRVRELRDLIFKGCDQPDALSGVEYGRINAARSLALLTGNAPDAGGLVASKSTIVLRARPGHIGRASSVMLRAEGGATAHWTATIDQPWLSLSAPEGDTPSRVSLKADATALSAGSYSATLDVKSDAGELKLPVDVSVGSKAKLAIELRGGTCAMVDGLMQARAGAPCGLSATGFEEGERLRWDIDGQPATGESVVAAFALGERRVTVTTDTDVATLQVAAVR